LGPRFGDAIMIAFCFSIFFAHVIAWNNSDAPRIKNLDFWGIFVLFFLAFFAASYGPAP
jgi:hypothetical protein